jgi:hypothetical protein
MHLKTRPHKSASGSPRSAFGFDRAVNGLVVDLCSFQNEAAIGRSAVRVRIRAAETKGICHDDFVARFMITVTHRGPGDNAVGGDASAVRMPIPPPWPGQDFPPTEESSVHLSAFLSHGLSRGVWHLSWLTRRREPVHEESWSSSQTPRQESLK